MRVAVAVAVGVLGLAVLLLMLDYEEEHPSVREARGKEEGRRENPIH